MIMLSIAWRRSFAACYRKWSGRCASMTASASVPSGLLFERTPPVNPGCILVWLSNNHASPKGEAGAV